MNDPATVLVVDDVPANRKLLADVLSNAGYVVSVASSGEEALEKVASAKPDLVLLDILMPGLNGYEVCKRIRAGSTMGVLPVVMVTALDPTEERIKGLEAGADDFLTKPINPAELLARVRSLLRIKSLYDTVQSQSSELAVLNSDLERKVQEQLAELQRLDQFKRFFAPQIAELIVSGEMSDPLKTHRSEVTVVLVKLRGFNALADTSEPEEIMAILRNYHREMGKAIDAHGGTLEQLSASTMMVVFNDPVMVEDSAPQAVRMAIDMRTLFEDLTSDWRRRGHEVSLGIGISHGYATIGSIGYESRLAYGVIGRVTNLASRLCDEAASDEILVTASVHALVDDLVEATETSQVNMEGFAKPVSVYNILGLNRDNAKNGDIAASPLRVHTFGQFAMHVNDTPLKFSRKVQKRPLDLIKALIAHGGERVEISGITSSLWPDAEGDTAKASFDSTLYRLRKLLGVSDVLPVSEGRLSLARDHCWIDVWAFEDLVKRIEVATASPDDVQTTNFGEMARALLQLYTGHFLEQESQEPWAIAARDHLRAKFVRAVTRLGNILEQRKDWSRAAELYLRALELDNLAEPLYRRLMIVYCEQGESAEAINIYRRCRDMLSVVLNTRPSEETEAVRRSIAG